MYCDCVWTLDHFEMIKSQVRIRQTANTASRMRKLGVIVGAQLDIALVIQIAEH